ncbi:DUF192 domain-containing protein [Rhodovulum adriaticum]|uniref:DUF192 domain-containing protein n=1 Tax=Rhodovulum adriaticum TaxID=35804 RepID=A0A4R2NU02_RHOAD|nr:DUF192 domain-containing protein [Rhodovulum adriaticum]MBK1636884.1 hypothetical protein [Rhodovulum adriaticum]TCP25372.1 hypothetical protein EV656_103122 [Rhodovulum adriaticum]
MGKRIFGSFAALSVALVLSAGAAGADVVCADDRVDLRGDWGQARFTVELADAPEERSRGLMHRDSLPRAAGMLFIYPTPQRVAFWMKNTLIPLDMLFLDAQGRVVRLHENARPLDETPIDGGPGVKAVLEINGGLAARLGIGPGTVLRHPALGQGAAWPCP